MAANDLNQKYTIANYCTRNDVARALGTNLIDPIWRDISDFRKRLQVELPLFDAFHTKFAITYIDSVQGKTALINSCITRYVTDFAKLRPGSNEEYYFKRDMLKQSLKSIAKVNNIEVNDVALTNILERKPVENQYVVLSRYFEALQAMRNEALDPINEEFLAKNLARLRGEQELTSFYRTGDFESDSAKFIIAKDYDNGVPAHLIDEMMASLLELVNSTSVSLVTRLSAIYFIFNYVKPFEKYNFEMASILAKRALAGTSINVTSIYIPIEYFLEDTSFFDEITKEVKKTHDFTYAFIKGADILNTAFSVVLDRLAIVHASAINEEVKLGSDERKIEQEFGFKAEKEIVKPYRVETKNEIQARLERNIPSNTESLSEKELRAKAKDLLERDPFLKKGQADFYVHHCTIGKFYTIQQYVKFEGCVYETARTSMDGLAKSGYYKREQIKNKFVYTPINKE